MAQITRVARNQSQKDIIKAFDSLQGKHNMHQLWSDFVVLMACTISNAVDSSHREEREKTYLSTAAQYTEKELNAFAQIFALIVEAYESNSNQDLLGELFMGLGLGNDSGGQFFTPYDVCRCTAQLTFGDTEDRIKEKGWVSVNDPAVGAGALLIAFANICEIKEINYQQHVLFVAQEIDFTTACMCYIHLSLLGCPGYVYVGDTLTDPCTSIDGNALIPAKPEKCWFTPMYFHQTWIFRRMIERMRLMERQVQCQIATKTAEIDSIPAAEAPIDTPVKKPKPKKGASTEAIIPAQDAGTDLLANESGQLMLF